MGNKEIVDRINRNRMLFTDRYPSLLEEVLIVFVICFIGAFIAFCISGA